MNKELLEMVDEMYLDDDLFGWADAENFPDVYEEDNEEVIGRFLTEINL